jgi:hypothetical protein
MKRRKRTQFRGAHEDDDSRVLAILSRPPAPPASDRPVVAECVNFMSNVAGPKRLDFFERYLSLWVLACMVVGVALGRLAPGLTASLLPVRSSARATASN